MTRFKDLLSPQPTDQPAGQTKRASRFGHLFEPEEKPATGLTMDQERAAEEWLGYNNLVRKHHGERSKDYLGKPAGTPEEEWGLAVETAKRNGWKSPEKSSGVDAFEAGMNDFAFGLGDEVGSAVQSGASFLWNLPGQGVEGAAKSAGDTFDRRMDESNFRMEKAHQDRPAETFATTAAASLIPGVGWGRAAVNGARAAPAVVSALPGAGSFISKAVNLGKTAGKVGLTGAAMGEVSGIGNARGDIINRVKEAGIEAPLWGAGAGVGGVAVGKLLGNVIKGADNAIRPIFMDADNRALFMIERAMKRDGVTVPDLMRAQARVKAMGGDTLEVLAEIAAYSGASTGKNLRGLSRALHAQPGKASEMAEKLIAKRRDAVHKGASKAVAAGTGQNVDNYSDQLSDLEDSLRTNSKKAYDDFRSSQVDTGIFDGRISPLLKTEPGRVAMTSARNAMLVDSAATRGIDPGLADELETAAMSLEARLKDMDADDLMRRGDTDGADALRAEVDANWQEIGGQRGMLPARALDEVKKAFDDQIDHAKPYTASNLRKHKNAFAEHVSAATGGAYGQALGTYSGGKRLREAIDGGYKAFSMKPHQLDDLLDGTGGPGGVYSQEEVEGIALGFGRAIQDAVDSNDLSAVRKVLRDKGMQSKLKKIMGASYPRFVSRFMRLANRQDFDSFVAGGSPTARIQAELADAQGEDTVSRVFNNLGSQAANGGGINILGALKAATIQPLAKGAGEIWNKVAYRGIGNDAVNEALGKRLFTPMTDRPMRKLASKMTTRPPQLSAKLPDAMGRTGGYMGALGAGRDAVPAGAPEERAEVLVEDFDGAMLEEYLDPATSPARLRQIEQHFGPQAAELWQMRASASAQQ
jgi:hypothetical protein